MSGSRSHSVRLTDYDITEIVMLIDERIDQYDVVIKTCKDLDGDLTGFHPWFRQKRRLKKIRKNLVRKGLI